MANIWYLSDPHLFHKNIIKFTDDNGKIIREFRTLQEHNEKILSCHNEVVKPGDKVYWLGDITFDYGPEFEAFFPRFHGKKRLIIGNHDIIKGTNLLKHFQKAQIWRIFKEHNFLITHIPAHPDYLRKVKFNVHGHLHQRVVMNGNVPDWRYISVCLEHTKYYPVHLDEILARIKKAA